MSRLEKVEANAERAAALRGKERRLALLLLNGHLISFDKSGEKR